MKRTITLYFIFIVAYYSGQEIPDRSDKREYNLYISAGAHLGFWAKDGQTVFPFNCQVDVPVFKKITLGTGYTYDEYLGDPGFFAIRTRPGKIRQNISVRMCKYFTDPDNVFATYIGFSGGLSVWDKISEGNNLYPTSQFLFGIKLTVFKQYFLHTEFGVGPPFMCQTSVGFKF